MSILTPELEYVDRAEASIRYLEHGWPTSLCRWHSHEVLELHMIVDTNGKVFVGDYIGEFGPGALFLIGPNLPHNWVTDDIGEDNTVPLRDRLIQFNLESIENLKAAFPEFRELDSLMQRASGGIEFINFDPDQAQRHFDEINNAKGAERMLKFMQFLLAVNAHPDQKTLSMANIAYPNFKANQSNIARVIDYIIEHYAEEISLDSAAEMANMSATAFARNFQKLTGSRFTEFLVRVRVGQACSLLQATDEKIATICHEVGFKNLANFNRHFLRIKETTPSSYRDFTRSELTTLRVSSDD